MTYAKCRWISLCGLLVGKVEITFRLPGTWVCEEGNGWLGCRRHSIIKSVRLQRRLNYQNWFQHKLWITLQKHVYNKLAAYLTGCQWFSPTHFQLWVGWLCWRLHELVLHASWVACTPSHPPPARVTTFLELVHCKIKYELDGYLPRAKSPLPLIKRNNDFGSALNALLFLNLWVGRWFTDHKT